MISAEAEHRLRQSLASGAMEEVERQLAPWSRAMGLLVALLGNMHASVQRPKNSEPQN